MIIALEGFPPNVAAFACHGHVRKEDYNEVLVPAVNKALQENEKVRLYYETAADFEGIDAGAVLEDTIVGVSHALRWEKLAVVTDVSWIGHAMKLFGFLIPGKLRVFPADESSAAKKWIVA